MVFEKRLAKIGKGFNVNLYLNDDKNINIILYNNSLQKKCLNIENEKYKLESVDSNFYGHECIKLFDDFYLLRIDSNLELVTINET